MLFILHLFNFDIQYFYCSKYCKCFCYILFSGMIYLVFGFVVLDIELRALCMLGKFYLPSSEKYILKLQVYGNT
jgi:hypothetical protein